MSTVETTRENVEAPAADDAAAESPEVEVLVEEISIDGMCGVY